MKFTTEEQKEIANYALEHENDYKKTGEKYGISYQQVAAWVRKYTAEHVSKPKSAKKKTTATKKTVVKESQPDNDSSEDNEKTTASTLDVLNRKDPVLEKRLEDVKRRLGLIK